MSAAPRQRFIRYVTLGYVFFAVVWIFLSDNLLVAFADTARMAWLSTVKGLGFVGVTAVLLFFVLHATPDRRAGRNASPLVETMAGGDASARWPRWLIYLFAVALTLAMLLLRSAIAVPFGDRPLLILYMFPIILGALLGGLGPGLLATAIAAAGAALLALPTATAVAAHDLLSWGFLVVNGIAVSLLSEALRRSLAGSEANRALLDAVVSGTSDAIFVKDARGRYLLCNRSAAELVGKKAGEVVGHDDTFLFSAPVAAELMAQDRDIMASGATRTYEEDLTTASGRPFTVQTSKGPVRDRSGRLIGVFGIARDITDRKRADAADAARLAAERLAREKGEFLANMSHEIRTPLNAVLGFAQVGRRASESPRSRRSFDRILDSGELLLGVINDILDYSKLEAGKLTLERVPVDIDAMLERAAGLMAAKARAKDLKFRVDIAPDLPAGCLGDGLRLSQVLVNLLSNAIKFTEHGDITLAAARDGDELVFRVADTGIGMDAAQIGRLFAAFEQADSSTTRQYGGTGLGLAISKRLIDLMAGSIRVDSQPGRGSRFELRLPYLAAEAPVPDETRNADGPRLTGLNLLAAEDNEVNRLVLEDILDLEGARLTCVENGREAVDRVRHTGPDAYDLVLMDIQMPEMDGYEATRRLHEIAPNLPVIGLTAHAMADERAKCIAAGMVEHVAKPIGIDVLVETILRYKNGGKHD